MRERAQTQLQTSTKSLINLKPIIYKYIKYQIERFQTNKKPLNYR